MGPGQVGGVVAGEDVQNLEGDFQKEMRYAKNKGRFWNREDM